MVGDGLLCIFTVRVEGEIYDLLRNQMLTERRGLGIEGDLFNLEQQVCANRFDTCVVQSHRWCIAVTKQKNSKKRPCL